MKHFRLILFVVFAVSAISCKPFFHAIKIKASPEFNMAAGSGTFNPDDFFSPKMVIDQINQTGMFSKATFLDYTKDDTMNMLIRYPITDLELNMADNFTVLNEAKKIMSSSLEKRTYKLQKPEKISKEIDLEFIQDHLYGGLQRRKELNVPKPVSGENTLPPIELLINMPFNKATFDTDTRLIFSTSTNNSQINLEITELELITTGGETLSSAGTSTPNILDLSGKTINKPEKFIIKSKVSGPASASVELVIETKFQGRIREAWGITFNIADHKIDDIILPLSLSSGDAQFEEAEISDGEIIINKLLPDEWTGFEVDYSKLNISQEQKNGVGLNLALSGNTTSLNGKTMNKNNIKISGDMGFTIQNAHYLYAEKGTAEFDIAIKKLGYVKLGMPENVKFSYKTEQPIPEDLKKWVKRIHFADLSIQLNLENKLPPDNDVDITILSNTFGINETKRFASNLSQNELIKKQNFDFEPGAAENMDFSVKVKFQHSSDEDNIITIKNIEIGKEYSFGGEFNITPNWEYADINPDGMEHFTGSIPEKADSYLEFGQLSELINKGLTFEELKARLYLNSDFLEGKGNKLKGKMYFSYTDKKNNLQKKEFLIGAENSFEEFGFVKPLPDEFYADTTNELIKYGKVIPESSKEIDFSKILRPEQTDIKFFYDISLSSLRINKSDIDTIEKTKLRTDILLEIPFKVKAEKDIVLKKINGTQDLLNRSNTGGEQISEQAVQSIKEIELKIKYKNPIGIGVKVKLTNNTESGTPEFLKEIKLQTSEEEEEEEVLLLTEQDIEYIKGHNPFIMNIEIIFPAGTHSFKRGKGIEIKPFLRAKCSVDQTIKAKNR